MRLTILAMGLCLAASAQSSGDAPKFEAADVHVSPKAQNPFGRTLPVRGGRYEIKTATMVDLVRMAYGLDADKILGGPNWVEMDRFDVVAKLPPGSTPETQKQMLQALLEDRFKLVTHKETKPLPTFALVQGKKHQLKEATGNESAGCKPQAGGSGPGGGGQLMMGNPDGTTTTIRMGPGMTVEFACRNMTMEAFVSGLRSMIGANIGTNPVIEETGLKGAWNFDLKYSLSFNGLMMMGQPDAERLSLSQAIEKQLGLKLEERQVPTAVIVIDKVNQKPSPNPPGTDEALPPVPMPTEFEVASIKATDANGTGPRMMRMQTLPGGRLNVDGMQLRFLINRAFNTNNNEYVTNVPKFAETDRYDIVAKAAVTGASVQLDMEAMAPLMRSLLADRFKLTYHTEDRPVTAYALVGAKSKMKKADPNSRTWCKNSNAPPGAPPGTRVFQCQNVTMDQFADRLQNMTGELNWPVANKTEVEGGWDLTLTFSMNSGMMMGGMPGGGRGGDPVAAGGGGGAAVPTASDPTGGYTLFEAIEKQLGLKLEKQKRSLPVIVIDHLEQKPTEN
jgi:uncharacterized protein (TIGR03435 family)